jgi:transcriptional regulator with XRE-family HTH domain
MTPELVKAARALLKWQQADLARAANISMATINNFERHAAVPRQATLAAIKIAFENNGIEFIGDNGLRRIEDITSIARYTGSDFIRKMNEDIYGTLRKAGSEFLSCSVDDALWRSKEARDANEEFNAWRKRVAIRDRILIPEGNASFNAPRQHYRCLPPYVIGHMTYNIFGDRIAFILWKKKQIVVIRNTLIVDTFRRQFNELWKMAKPA